MVRLEKGAPHLEKIEISDCRDDNVELIFQKRCGRHGPACRHCYDLRENESKREGERSEMGSTDLAQGKSDEREESRGWRIIGKEEVKRAMMG